MVLTPSAFTYEHLNGLKFKELQKLSVQFRVNKRWAKKQELIENLLAIKPSGHLENEVINTESQVSDEWRDGSVVFNDLKPECPDNCTSDKRLTFNVLKPTIDSRLTFDVPPKEASLLCEKNSTSTYLRETYEVPQKKNEFELEPLKESRATYKIPQNRPLLLEMDPRATYEVPMNDNDHFQHIQNELKDIDKSSEISCNKESSKHEFKNLATLKTPAKSLPYSTSGSQSIKKTEVKMLTIPYSKVPRRHKKDKEDGKHNNLLNKLSQKSINIKKTKLPTKLDMIKSPTTSIRKPAGKPQTIKSLPKFDPKKNSVPSKIPTILSFADKTLLKPEPLEKTSEGDKENSSRILRRRKSKTADEVLIKKPNIQAKVNFMSPPVTSNRNHRPLSVMNKTPMTKDNNDLITRKPITAKKMPNFNKIHQKQFEQMDSLPDYLKKKEERTRKLFGTPLQTLQQKTPKIGTVFKFQSSTAINLESKFAKSTENLRNVKGKAQKDTVKNRLPPSKLQMDAKDKSRNHIIGVRTNKRFELQMKLRNM